MTGPQWVRDPLTGREHLIVPAGSAAKPTAAENAAAPCPFCPDREATQPGVHTVYTAAGPITVHDNPWPISPLGHLVLVLSDRHHTRGADVTGQAWAAAILAALTQFPPGSWPLMAANVGALGSASVAHVHAQAVALTQPAPICQQEAAALAARRCVLCSADGTTVDGMSDTFRVQVTRHAAELLIFPATHDATLGQDDALAVGNTLARLWSRLDEAGWGQGQLVLHHQSGDFHWHLHLTPMLRPVGCVERGTGLTISRRSPTDLAAALGCQL